MNPLIGTGLSISMQMGLIQQALKEHNALTPNTAKTLEEINIWHHMFNYSAIHMLMQNNIIAQIGEDRYYLIQQI